MARRVEDAQPTKRRGDWYYIRRMPDEFREVDPRTRIEQTTGIRIADDPRGMSAREVVRKLDETAPAFWVNKREGRDADAVVRYERSVQLAQSRGVNYLPAESVAELTIDEIVRRVRIMANDAADDPKLVSAFLGGEPVPTLLVSQMLGEFEKLTAASRVGQSEGQQKRWRTPKETAIGKFIEVIGGDRPMDSLATQDALAFRMHWSDRVCGGEVQMGSFPVTTNRNLLQYILVQKTKFPSYFLDTRSYALIRSAMDNNGEAWL